MRGLGLLSAQCIQVGKEVIEQFMAFDPIAETAFDPIRMNLENTSAIFIKLPTTPQQIRNYPNLRWGALHIQ